MSPFTTLIYVHINAATIQHVQKCCYQKVLKRPKLVTLGTYQTPPTNDWIRLRELLLYAIYKDPKME